MSSVSIAIADMVSGRNAVGCLSSVRAVMGLQGVSSRYSKVLCTKEQVETERLLSLDFGPGTQQSCCSGTPPGRGKMSDEDLKAELERLRRENEALKQGAVRGVSLKVSAKGGVSVYG